MSETGTKMKTVETKMHGVMLVEYVYGPFTMRVVSDGRFQGIENNTEVVQVQPDYIQGKLKVKTWGVAEVDVDVLIMESKLAKEAKCEFEEVLENLAVKVG